MADIGRGERPAAKAGGEGIAGGPEAGKGPVLAAGGFPATASADGDRSTGPAADGDCPAQPCRQSKPGTGDILPPERAAGSLPGSSGPAAVPRRDFLWTAALAWSGIALAAAGAITAAVRFLFPRFSGRGNREFSAGDISDSDIAPGSVVEKHARDRGVFLVRLREDGEDKLVALSAVCTHLGCRVSWVSTEGIFRCPCHGSVFLPDGRNASGPAPRSLERFAICVGADGRIMVDTSRVFRVETGGWRRRESYVPMS
ncbi:MAG: ubiquinol-cytochrome c reductase iron-sulfur subunit [Planctomycetota bacterium]|nr:ubiquinol-cytochrome c reductase iron-sulfur subunit [Planctomycetota bacterium]